MNAAQTTKSPKFNPFTFCVVGLLILLILALATGCGPIQGPGVTVLSEVATITVIDHQPAAKQRAVAQAAYNVAGAISLATQTNPDLSSIQAVTRPLVHAEIQKLAPQDALVIQLIVDLSLNSADIAYVQAVQAATATDKGKAAQAIVQEVTAGIQAGARIILDKPPTATQPN